MEQDGVQEFQPRSIIYRIIQFYNAYIIFVKINTCLCTMG